MGATYLLSIETDDAGRHALDRLWRTKDAEGYEIMDASDLPSTVFLSAWRQTEDGKWQIINLTWYKAGRNLQTLLRMFSQAGASGRASLVNWDEWLEKLDVMLVWGSLPKPVPVWHAFTARQPQNQK